MPSTSELTSEQLAALQAAILANAAFAGWNLATSAQEVASWYNQVASPAWVVWRTSVPSDELYNAIFESNGGLQLDALTASKRDSLFKLIDRDLDASIAAARANVDDYCGSQANLKAALQASQKRNATYAERLFSGGTGSTASPATMTFEGALTYQQVEAALALP